MRILVLLLAPKDEMDLAWPALRALRRSQPDRDIHLVTAHQGPWSIEGFHFHRTDEDALKTLDAMEFDQVFNLSFSEDSARLASRFSGPRTRVCGYTLHTNGSLAIPDDTSAYVYAQVGPDRPNRYHWTTIYAAVLGVELTESDVVQELRRPAIEDDEFEWSLIQALYTSADYPPAPDEVTTLGFQRLLEASELAVNLTAKWNQNPNLAKQQLAVIDQTIGQVSSLAPLVSPVVRWFQTERLRFGPLADSDFFPRANKLYSDLFLIASVYGSFQSIEQTRQTAAELCQKCGPAFREWEIAPATDEFQKLITSFHELARHSERLGERPWSSILKDLINSFDRRDYLDVADQIEYTIAPKLRSGV